ISRTMSSSPIMSRYGSIGVAGRRAMEALEPAERNSRAKRIGAADASAWKVTESTPSCAYSGAQRSAFSIIRCTSIGSLLTLCNASTTGKPKVRLGTKWLSMTSTWTASAVWMRSSSAARFAKSADRIDGLIRALGMGAPWNTRTWLSFFGQDGHEHGIRAVHMRPQLNGGAIAQIMPCRWGVLVHHRGNRGAGIQQGRVYVALQEVFHNQSGFRLMRRTRDEPDDAANADCV